MTGGTRPAGSPLGGSHRPWLAGAMGIYLVLAVFGAWQTWLHSHDDAYITYVFARNFAAGNGLTWNGGGGLGTTSPLLAVILGTCERLLALGVPVWGHLLAWTAIFTTAVAVLLLGRQEGWPAAGFLTGLGWLVSPAAVDFLGGEYPVAVAAVTVAAMAAAGRRPLLLAVSLAFAVGLRNEMGIAAVLLAAAALARDGWRGSLWLRRGAAGALGLWGAWLLTLYALAGTALPATLEAKRAQAASPFPFYHGGTKFLLKVFRASEDFFYPAGVWFFWILAVLGLVHLVRHCRHRPRWLVAASLALWGPSHLVALAILDVPYYPWYSIPFHFSILVLVALTAQTPRRFPGRARTIWQIATAVLLAALLLNNGGRNLKRHGGRFEDPREVAYTRLSEWISERYPPATRVATFEVGYLGYHGRFVTLDLLGLTTPETPFDAVREADFPRVVEVLEPDLLVVPEPFPELSRALVGDVREFLDEFELDYIDRSSWPFILLYRHQDLAGRGDVVTDLLASSDAPASYHVKARMGAPALVLAPGESRAFELGFSSGVELATSLAPARKPPAAARIRLLDGDGQEIGREERAQAEHRWLRWTRPLPEAAAGATLDFVCLPESASACLFAMPRLRQSGCSSP